MLKLAKTQTQGDQLRKEVKKHQEGLLGWYRCQMHPRIGTLRIMVWFAPFLFTLAT
jgi:hypothetical protein